MNLSAEESSPFGIVEVGEDLLRRAQEAALAIEERVWKAMAAQGLPGPPAPGRGPAATPEGQGGRT
jgi:hypothetical protein